METTGIIFLSFIVALIIIDLLRGIKNKHLSKVQYLGVFLLFLISLTLIYPDITKFNMFGIGIERRIKEEIEIRLEEFFDNYVREDFFYNEVKNFKKYTDEEGTVHLEIPLSNVPIQNSLLVWYDDGLFDPTDYLVKGNIIDLLWNPDFEVRIGDDDELVVVQYIKKPKN